MVLHSTAAPTSATVRNDSGTRPAGNVSHSAYVRTAGAPRGILSPTWTFAIVHGSRRPTCGDPSRFDGRSRPRILPRLRTPLSDRDYKAREGIHWNERGHRRMGTVLAALHESVRGGTLTKYVPQRHRGRSSACAAYGVHRHRDRLLTRMYTSRRRPGWDINSDNTLISHGAHAEGLYV